MISSVILVLVLFTSAQADQDTAAQAKEPAKVVQEQQGEPAKIRINGRLYEPGDIVCKRERVSGSRITKKLCNTARQWELLRVNAENLTREMTEGINSINNGG